MKAERASKDKPAGGEGSTISIGDIHHVGGSVQIAGRDLIHQAGPAASLPELQQLIVQIQQLVPQAGLDADASQAVLADLRTVQTQATKEKPNRAIILGRLKSATEILTAAGGLAAAVQKIAPLLERALELARQLFS